MNPNSLRKKWAAPLGLALFLLLFRTNSHAQILLCPDQYAVLTVIGDTGTIQWQQSLNGTAFTDVPGATSDSFQVSVPDTMWFRAKIVNGTCDPFYSDTSYVIPSTLRSHAGPDVVVCLGGSGVVVGSNPTATGGTPPYNYYWSPGNGLSNTNIANPICNPNQPVTYILTISDSNGCIAKDTLHADTTSLGCIPGADTFNVVMHIDTFIVPSIADSVTIDARGAQGGNTNGGKGARMVGTFAVTPGETLYVVVGQQGIVNTCGGGNASAGGGGGTFVWRASAPAQPLIAAGGGGGGNTNWNAGACQNGIDAVTTANGTSGSMIASSSAPGGTGGNGGSGTAASGVGSGGTGWLSAGGNSTYGNGCTGGLSYPLFTGGSGASNFGPGGEGGYGGGGGAVCGCGGGGGYSGGGGGEGAVCRSGGGGGGSYNSGSNQNNTPGYQTGNGIVYITW